MKKREFNGIADKGAARALFLIGQWTWGLSVNLIGGLIFLLFLPFCRHERFHNAYITYVPARFGGFSMGLFIFMAAHGRQPWTYNTRIHEYGHTIQCLVLGPFYWPVVALPSAFWCNVLEGYRRRHHISYYKLYCESWANKWGEKWSGEKRKAEKE